MPSKNVATVIIDNRVMKGVLQWISTHEVPPSKKRTIEYICTEFLKSKGIEIQPSEPNLPDEQNT